MSDVGKSLKQSTDPTVRPQCLLMKLGTIAPHLGSKDPAGFRPQFAEPMIRLLLILIIVFVSIEGISAALDGVFRFDWMYTFLTEGQKLCATIFAALAAIGFSGIPFKKAETDHHKGGRVYLGTLLLFLLWWSLSSIHAGTEKQFIYSHDDTLSLQFLLICSAISFIHLKWFRALIMRGNEWRWIASFGCFFLGLILMIGDTDHWRFGIEGVESWDSGKRIGINTWNRWRAWDRTAVLVVLSCAALVLHGVRLKTVVIPSFGFMFGLLVWCIWSGGIL